jgi:hypothetical protein
MRVKRRSSAAMSCFAGLSSHFRVDADARVGARGQAGGRNLCLTLLGVQSETVEAPRCRTCAAASVDFHDRLNPPSKTVLRGGAKPTVMQASPVHIFRAVIVGAPNYGDG